jgi:hypothetical protein
LAEDRKCPVREYCQQMDLMESGSFGGRRGLHIVHVEYATVSNEVIAKGVSQ